MRNSRAKAANTLSDGSMVPDSTFETYAGDIPIARDSARALNPLDSRFS